MLGDSVGRARASDADGARVVGVIVNERRLARDRLHDRDATPLGELGERRDRV